MMTDGRLQRSPEMAEVTNGPELVRRSCLCLVRRSGDPAITWRCPAVPLALRSPMRPLAQVGEASCRTADGVASVQMRTPRQLQSCPRHSPLLTFYFHLN